MTNIWNHQLGHYWWIALKHEVVTDVTKLASEKIREVSHHFRHLSQQCDFHRHFFWCFFSLPETDGLHGQGEFSFSGQHTHRHFLTNTYLLGDFVHTTLLRKERRGRVGDPPWWGWKKPTRRIFPGEGRRFWCFFSAIYFPMGKKKSLQLGGQVVNSSMSASPADFRFKFWRAIFRWKKNTEQKIIGYREKATLGTKNTSTKPTFLYHSSCFLESNPSTRSQSSEKKTLVFPSRPHPKSPWSLKYVQSLHLLLPHPHKNLWRRCPEAVTMAFRHFWAKVFSWLLPFGFQIRCWCS